jgi:hypothetical protein
MMRPLMSYALASLILLSQVGVPVHMHYCKGMLESVSVFVKSVCEDHQEQEALPACCKKLVADHCPKEKDKCCDDQVKVLTQEITSLMPHFLKWLDIVSLFNSPSISLDKVDADVVSFQTSSVIESDSGPPIYILHQALILYA